MGHQIKELTHPQIKELLGPGAVVVLPIGGGSKEHGGHLPLGTDYYVTDWVAARVTERCDVLTLPTLPYAYFPAFIEWEGSVSVDPDHFTAYVADIIKSYMNYGVRKFLIIDGGVSTHPPLVTMSRELMNKNGAYVAVSNISTLASDVEKEVCEQKRGGHGDESETSTMLVIRPDLVHMENACEEYSEAFPGTVTGGIRRIDMMTSMSTPNGTNGNSRLATREKGEAILAAMVDNLCVFLEEFIKYEVK
ncbi:MAG: creatininase family protein [Firmicutes bacterium]|nr:creatininase family protein [Bacillota bacterium]